jgi:TnpA family transposase
MLLPDGEGISAASAILVASQARIDITGDWGGGLVASADGMRFVVPVRSLYARPSPLYFGKGKRPRGATWLNVVSDKVMGLGLSLTKLSGAANAAVIAGQSLDLLRC